MQDKLEKNYGLGLGLATIIALSIVGGLSAPAVAPPGSEPTNSGPANKLAAAGSNVVFMSPGATEEILSTSIKVGGPKELVLQLTAECALITTLTTVGNDMAEAFAQVQTWVELDGKVVPVTTTAADDGRVVLCNRLERRATMDFDDEDARIDTFQETRQANAFNWLTFDVGSGTHTIKVFAEFVTNTEGDATAFAGVGKRTLIVEPVHAPNGATI